MSEFTVNLIYCALYIASGAAVLCCLKKLRFILARNVFAVLYGLLMIYVPFYIGGNIMSNVMVGIYKNPYTADLFQSNFNELLNAPGVAFRSLSIITVVMAVIIGIATAVALYLLAKRVVKWIKCKMAVKPEVLRPGRRLVQHPLEYIANYRRVYLSYCRLLN